MTAGTVIVTGGSRGIGRAIAQRYADAGWQVLAPPREHLDLADPGLMNEFAAQLAEQQVDVLVANAAENHVVELASLDLGTWQRTLDVNLTSALRLSQAVLPGMTERGWGRIVMISSCYSFLSRRGRASYSASKSALNSLTRSIAVEYGNSGVLCNAVCPGFVTTDLTRQNNDQQALDVLASQTAVGRLAEPAEIAELVFFLGSHSNTYVTGQAVVIDGGFTCQ